MHLWTVRYLKPSVSGVREVAAEVYGMARADARAEIQRKGGTVVAISPARVPWWRGLTPRGREHALQMLMALHFHAASLPPQQAVEAAIRYEPNRDRRLAFTPARAVLDGGGDFTDALRATGLFDPATLAILQAGERTAALRETLAQAVAQLRARARGLRRVALLGVWLVADVFTIVSTIGGVRQGLPWLRQQGIRTRSEEVRAAFERGLERAEAINDVLAWLTAVLLFAAAWFAARYWRNRHKPEHPAVRFVHRLPGVRGYVEDLAMASSWHVMARLALARVHPGAAIDIVVDTVWYSGVRRYWNDVQHALAAGTVGDALARAPLSAAEQGLVATHQTVADLALVAENIAEHREQSADVRQRHLVLWGIVGTLLYIATAAGNFAYLIILYNQSSAAGFEHIRQML